MKSKKTFWPWGITITYIIFFIALISFFIFSTQQNVDLVSDDYYQKGLEYQQQINLINRTSKLDKSLQWNYNQKTNIVQFIFPQSNESQVIEGNILFFRPSDGSKDKIFTLNLSAGKNIKDINVKNLARGLWKIKAHWSMNGEGYYNEGILVL